MKVPAGLIGGPLHLRALMVDHDTEWLFISPVHSSTKQAVIAQWPHEHAPSSMPDIPRPIVCYRYRTDDPKRLFEYEPKWSDEVDGEEAETTPQ